jgi:hypothetical protein
MHVFDEWVGGVRIGADPLRRRGRYCIDCLYMRICGTNCDDLRSRNSTLYHDGRFALMPMTAIRQPVTSPDEHILTVREALEPLFLKLEAQVDLTLIDAAVEAGWEPEEVLLALDDLRKH